MGESEAGNGLYRGKPHQAINTSLCTKQNVDLSVYFSSLQERTRHGHLNSQDVCGRISTLTNKGTEAGDNGGFLSTPDYGVGCSETAVCSLLVTTLLKGQFLLPVVPPRTHASATTVDN